MNLPNIGYVVLVLLSVLPLVGSPLFAEDGAAPGTKQDSVALETIALGPESSYACRGPTLLVIRDTEDWGRVWNLHHGREASQHQLPDIDFELFSIIALFAGRSAIEGVQIVRFERDDSDGVMIYAVAVEPGLGCMGPKIMRNPFHIARVPAMKKNSLPSLQIEFLSRHCVK